MTRSVLFDTETTGLDPAAGHRVIEVAALELINDLPTGRHFHALIHPDRDIPEDAVRIHGITLDAAGGQAALRRAIDGGAAGVLRRRHAGGAQRAVRFRLPQRRAGAARLAPRWTAHAWSIRWRWPRRGFPACRTAWTRCAAASPSTCRSAPRHNALLDCRLLAEVYVELTGGRQRGLSLAERTQAACRPRLPMPPPVRAPPRLSQPSAAELAAHAAFVARLKDPLWAKA